MPEARSFPSAHCRNGVRRLKVAGHLALEPKVRVPAPRGLVHRRHLVRLLAKSVEVPLVLVAAPGGYGKTTLLAQWAQSDQRPFAWVSVDAADNDPARFLGYVLLALMRLRPTDEDVADTWHPDAEDDENALARLSQIVARMDTSFVLVLDSADLLSNDVCLDAISRLAGYLQSGSQLAVAARREPRLPWGTYRAQGRLVTLGPAELDLSIDEGNALLAGAGLDLPRDDALALVLQTEGWPAGLQLAATIVRADGGGEAAVARFMGDEAVLGDYLRNDLIAQMSPSIVTFLTRTSVLDELTPELCDAVLRRHGSGTVLRELARSNLFLFPIDAHEGHYRYHHLFAAMLRAELRQREPELEAALHARASDWLADHADFDPAISHARHAGDLGRAARLVWSQFATCLASGKRSRVERWLEGFATSDVLEHPLLSLATAWCALESGRPVEPWLASASRGASSTTTDEAAAVTSALAIFRAMLCRDGVAQMLDDARLADHLQAPADPWRSLAQYFQAVARYLAGDRTGALALLEDAERLAAALGAHSPRACILAQLALVATEQGEWDRAERLAQEATAVTEEHDLVDLTTTGSVVSVAALLLTHSGRLDEARLRARQARRAMAQNPRIAPWNGVQARVVLARAYLLLGDAPAARVLLSEAQNLVKQVPDAPVLQARLDEAWRMAETLPVSTGAGPSALTTAELRVLQFLPTHLSFEEVGKRLCLSRNTVKTQAIAAYRKLGVSSRAEAVEQAHRCGLLPEVDRSAAW